MSDKLNTKYSPKLIESKWYNSWLKNDLFKWNNSSKKNTFSIQLPPPNVTGSLHMGHAYQQTLMDILRDGAAKASNIAEKTLDKVRENVGIVRL